VGFYGFLSKDGPAEEFEASLTSPRDVLIALEIIGITESKGDKFNYIKDNLNFP